MCQRILGSSEEYLGPGYIEFLQKNWFLAIVSKKTR
jgi:hypothetical protein